MLSESPQQHHCLSLHGSGGIKTLFAYRLTVWGTISLKQQRAILDDKGGKSVPIHGLCRTLLTRLYTRFLHPIALEKGTMGELPASNTNAASL